MNPSTIDELLHNLTSEDLQQRQHAALALARLKDSRIIEALLHARHDPDSTVRAHAAAGLGVNEAVRAMDPLLSLLKDEVANVRGNAAWALGELDTETLIPALIPLLEDESPEVRGKTCWALGRLGEHTGNTSMVTSLLTLLDDYTETPDSSAHIFVCQYAAEALAQIGTPEAQQAVQSWKPVARERLLPYRIQDLIGTLQHKDHETRDGAIRQLLQIGISAMTALIDALQASDHARVRQGCAQTLGEMDDQRAVHPLIMALADPDPGVWSQATAALAKLGRQSEKALRPALGSTKTRVRQGAAIALWRIKREAKAFPVLLQALQDDELVVRSSAITSLWMEPDERAIATLQIQLQREEGMMANYIVQALNAIGTPAAQATINHWVSANRNQT